MAPYREQSAYQIRCHRVLGSNFLHLGAVESLPFEELHHPVQQFGFIGGTILLNLCQQAKDLGDGGLQRKLGQFGQTGTPQSVRCDGTHIEATPPDGVQRPASHLFAMR